MIKSQDQLVDGNAQHRSILEFITSAHDPLNLKQQFLDRLEKGNLTRDENAASHFCAFFAPFDPDTKEVFIGHHIKGDRWLFNGGHLDLGETPLQTVKREMQEEWGNEIGHHQILEPNLITITHIDSPSQTCKTHFDLWFFVQLNKDQFKPNPKLLAEEFHQWGWKSEAEARAMCKKDDVHETLNVIYHDLV